MTSKTSLFNKGIYKSTVKRFVWGSVLYFIILFVCTSFAMLMSIDPKQDYLKMINQDMTPMLYQSFFIAPSLITGMSVSTIVALLVFRFVHSKKQSVFIHGLPVCRTANFVSTLAGAFTLMLVPVILNTVILAVLSIFRYGEFFTITSCFVWMGMNILCLFMMFSVSALAAMLTGNSFAMVAINGMLHCFLLIIAGGFGQLAELFLYGYASENAVLDFLIDRCFPVAIINAANGLPKLGNLGELVFCAVLSVILYAAAYVLYRLRRMETAEDVAAFKCLDPIYKYLVTFMAALGIFVLFSELLGSKPYLVIILTAIVTVVAYFASEMVLKKTLRVWKSYKGCLGFAAVFAAVICVFAYTSFFGYETRIPDVKDIAKAGVSAEIDSKAIVNDGELIEYFTDTQKALLSDRTVLNRSYLPGYDYSDTSFYITYELKNGKTFKRSYRASNGKYAEIVDRAYENAEFKKLSDEFYTDKIDYITRANVWANYDASGYKNGDINITDADKIAELFEAVKSDTDALSYSEMYNTNRGITIRVEFEFAVKPSADGEEQGTARTFEIAYTQYEGDDRRYSAIGRYINPNYQNTLKWLRDNGYGDILSLDKEVGYYIRRNTVTEEMMHADRMNDERYDLTTEEFAKINAEDIEKLEGFAWSYSTRRAAKDDAPIYKVYASEGTEPLVYAGEEPLLDIYEDDLPEFLKKYTAK